jgi:hypothetical protein
VNAPAGSREVGDLVGFRKGSLVDLPEEIPLGIFSIRFDLEVESDRDKVLLDDLEVRVAEEPGPGSSTGASGPAQGMPIAYPYQQRFTLGCRLLPRLPQIGHPGEIIEATWPGLDQPLE